MFSRNKKYLNKFNNEIMLQKQQELKEQLKNLNKNIKELDYLRSHIINGKIIDKLPSESHKIKSLYKEENR
ncbi:MAG: hypothetical protein HFI87_01845 [Bacilli bacterium]|nr:hypothetical protein [Bacilli bacterium]